MILENYGVQEMNTKEIRDVDGGGWPSLLKRLGPIATAAWIIEEVVDFIDEMNKPNYVN